jgi:thiol-disulfide isomerase/thioredoxin
VDLIDRLDPTEDFNFRHFRMRHMIAELLRTKQRRGIGIGQFAPDFELQTPDENALRLSELRGRPVMLRFVNYTCPVTRGGASVVKQLHEKYGETVQFVDVFVRQAHPGGVHGPYTSMAQKIREAENYRRQENVSWPVVVDDLVGTVQRLYGGLAASAYLLDAEGRVVFYALWGPALPLANALDELARTGRVAAPSGLGIDATPHLGAAAIVAGQRGPGSGGIQSLFDLELAFPGAMMLIAGGWVGRPLLRPLVLRTTALRPWHKGLLLGVIVAGVALSVRPKLMQLAATCES